MAGGVVFAAGCAQSGTAEHTGQAVTAAVTSPTVTTSPVVASSVTTTSAGTGAAQSAPAGTPALSAQRPTLKFGAAGADVKTLQERLRALHYDPGTADGKYGETTRFALYAFEKVNRLKLNGTVGGSVWKALDKPRTPKPLVSDAENDRVEIDLSRQLLYVYTGGKLALISHISSGGGYRYCAKDPGAKTARCRYAVTPTGDYQTGRRVTGWDNGPLGNLYKPVYFNGGIAVHGYPSVPLKPVSHGCVRVPMHTADVFQRIVGTGVVVHVLRTG
jgi:peptidoglycan hydrolase-like protein with peptidoglycan-binding domain